jgi:hypothetical protein
MRPHLDNPCRQVVVHTSDRPGAGLAPLGAHVIVELVGDSACMGPVTLSALTADDGHQGRGNGVKAAHRRFGRGAVDKFLLPPSRDCGELQLLRVRVEGKVSNTLWYKTCVLAWQQVHSGCNIC